MSSNKQNISLKESLSAMADGEASELELRRILQTMNNGESEADALRDRWQRYQLASAAMRKQPAMLDIDVSSAISEAVQSEPTHSASKTKESGKKPSILINLARLGIAASIAGAMVIGLQSVPEQDDVQLADSQFNGLALNTKPVSINSQPVSNNPAPLVIDQKHLSQAQAEQYKQLQLDLNRLMSEHAQNASQNTQFGILPYAKLPASE